MKFSLKKSENENYWTNVAHELIENFVYCFGIHTSDFFFMPHVN